MGGGKTRNDTWVTEGKRVTGVGVVGGKKGGSREIPRMGF